MPSVLIIGATGYLGLPLAQSLLRSGLHTVYGLARTPAKATLLAQNEITPVVGDAGDAASWTAILADAPIDIVVDASSAYAHSAAILDAVTSYAKSRAATLAGEGIAHAPRVGFVYVSGTWVHGSTANRAPTTDLRPVGSAALSAGTPAAATAWRPAHEQRVLAAGAGADALLDVAVVRPSMVYGRNAWTFGALFQPLIAAAQAGGDGGAKVQLAPEALMALVHVDDLTDALHRVVDRVGGGRLGAWPVFDVVSEVVKVRALAATAAGVLGVKGEVELVGTGGDAMLDAVSLRANLKAERAQLVLGWQPRQRSILQDMGRVVKAFEAHAQ